MSWTVACFCGETYSAPPTECPRCTAALPEPGGPSLARAGNRRVATGGLASIADARRGLR